MMKQLIGRVSPVLSLNVWQWFGIIASVLWVAISLVWQHKVDEDSYYEALSVCPERSCWIA